MPHKRLDAIWDCFLELAKQTFSPANKIVGRSGGVVSHGVSSWFLSILGPWGGLGVPGEVRGGDWPRALVPPGRALWLLSPRGIWVSEKVFLLLKAASGLPAS